MSQQIKAVEAQYPNGMPPDVHSNYLALIDHYNAAVKTSASRSTPTTRSAFRTTAS